MGGEERGRGEEGPEGKEKRGYVKTVTLASLSQSAFQEDLCDLASEVTEAGSAHSQQEQVGDRRQAAPAVPNLLLHNQVLGNRVDFPALANFNGKPRPACACSVHNESSPNHGQSQVTVTSNPVLGNGRGWQAIQVPDS